METRNGITGAILLALCMLLSPSLSAQILHAFNNSDGNAPIGKLVESSNGFFYGTTSAGGAHDCGTIYRISPTGDFELLRSLSQADGCNPPGGLVRGPEAEELFYGVAEEGGVHDRGTAFRITPAGAFTRLHDFGGILGEAEEPNGPLLLTSDGHFHGTAGRVPAAGGIDRGAIFRMTTSGDVEIVYSFPRTSSLGPGEIVYGSPRGGVVQGNDGHLYAIGSGGEHNDGSLLRVTLAGEFTPMMSFRNDVTGRFPRSPPTVGVDGALYGTLALGGTGNQPLGSIYRLTGDGAFSIVHQFNITGLFSLGGPNGSLLLADDDNLYGWANGIFRMTPDGDVSTVSGGSTTTLIGQGSGHGVIQGSDGRLYGVTQGANGNQGQYGAVFSLATSVVGSPPSLTPDPTPPDPAPSDTSPPAATVADGGGGGSGNIGLAMLLLLLAAVAARKKGTVPF